MNAKRALNGFRAPDELGAQQRGWGVVSSAYRADARTGARRFALRRPAGVILASLVAASVLVLSLSPAGATVGRLVDRALGVDRAAPLIGPLPSGGRLLLSGARGTWIVDADGSARRVGPWRQASWSPHGLYLAVAAAHALAAVNTRGALQWMLAEPDVSDPRWYSPSGYRVAYLARDQLRVVAGDGAGDHLLAAPVAHVAPAWRPGHAYQLAYVDAGGRLVVRDAGSGRELWSAEPRARVRQLSWSADGRRLLASSPARLLLYTAAGRLLARLEPGARRIGGSALSPDGRDVAVVTRGRSGAVLVYARPGRHASPRRVLSGAGLGQVVWSPDGRWLLASWPAANQWVYLRTTGRPQIAAVARIAQQFSTSSSTAPSRAPFPHIDGWCCNASGAAR